MHTEFKPWLADKATCWHHIVEFIRWSSAGRMFTGILEKEVLDLATDCWIWIWEGGCVTRTYVKECYGGLLVGDWKGDKMTRMSVKVAVTYYLRQMGKNNTAHKKFIKAAYKEMLMQAEIKTTGERIEFDLKNEERVLMLWNAGEIETGEAMERLSLSSRQSLYTRFEALVQRLKMELNGENTAL